MCPVPLTVRGTSLVGSIGFEKYWAKLSPEKKEARLAKQRVGGFCTLGRKFGPCSEEHKAKISKAADKKRAKEIVLEEDRLSRMEARRSRVENTIDEKIDQLVLAAKEALSVKNDRVGTGMQWRSDLMDPGRRGPGDSFSSLSVPQLERLACLRGIWKPVNSGRAWVRPLRDAAFAALQLMNRKAADALELVRTDALIPGSVKPKYVRPKKSKPSTD